jgi:hypothetical protein
MGGGLVAHTLNEQRDLNAAEPLFEHIAHAKSDPEMVQLAVQLIARQTSEYDPADLEDRYETRLRAMLDAKVQGEEATSRRKVVSPPPRSIVAVARCLSAWPINCSSHLSTAAGLVGVGGPVNSLEVAGEGGVGGIDVAHQQLAATGECLVGHPTCRRRLAGLAASGQQDDLGNAGQVHTLHDRSRSGARRRRGRSDRRFALNLRAHVEREGGQGLVA